MHSFCSICGVLIHPTSASGFALPTEDVQWHQELRAVRRDNSNGITTLTGVGYLNSSARIIAPSDKEDSYRAVGSSLRSFLPLYDSGNWTFTFHAACWDVLNERILEDSSLKYLLSHVLYDVIHCTCRNKQKYLQPGHDFDGAAKFQRPIGNPLQRMAAHEENIHFLTEPTKLINMDDAFRCANHESVAARGTSNAVVALSQPEATPTTYVSDIFFKLPVEILYLLLTWLSSHAIRQLRLASISVARVTRTSFQLPQFFWRSRFAPDLEMGFALPSHADQGPQDWRALYLAIRHDLRLSHQSPRLRNRRRIWELVSKNACLFSLHIQGIRLHGLSVPSNQGFSYQESSGKFTSAELTFRDSDILYSGSRQIFVRSLRAQRQGMHAIAVSTIFFNSRMFISGFRIFYRGTDTHTLDYASHSLGYIAKDSETLLRFSDPNSLDGYELAVCVNGIVGLRILSKSGSHSSWAGNIDQPEVAFGTFRICHTIHPFNIICDFDSFKMVSFAITHLETSGSSNLNSNSKGLVPQPLWTPCYPRKASLMQMPEMPNYQTFNPILNIDFGGSRGERLQMLTRITVHMNEPAAAFVGLAFEYDEYVLFGRQGRLEISFLIDGSNGERISEVTFEQVSTSLGIRSLYICTNFGNSVIFMPDELRQDLFSGVSSDTLDTPLRPAGKKPGKVNYTKQTMRAVDSQVVTGFTSILEATNGSFQTFGLQCLAEPMPTVHRQCVTDGKDPYAAELCSSTGSHLIRSASWGCQAYTYASLESVRSIRVSRGSMGRPRESNEISGLRFDYFDGPPKIVGQWLSEADHMDFIPGERVVEISICISKLGFSVNEKSHFGRLISISILTSQQSKTVHEDQLKDDCFKYNFRENRLEKLSSIVWAFNSASDHPRVLSSPITEGIRLWHPRDYANLFPCLVPDKILWEEQGWDRVRSITVCRSPYGQAHHITSLVFTYDSGLSRNIGNVPGEPSGETLSIMHRERIVGIDSLSGYHGLLKITVHLERLVEDGQHARRSHTFDDEDGFSRKQPVAVRDSIELPASRWMEYAVEGQSQRMVTDGELPRREAVGLWGFNMDSGGVLTLGVIFFKEVTQSV